jgi:hypothetical protein
MTLEQETLLCLYVAMWSKFGMIVEVIWDIEAIDALARDTGVSPAHAAMCNIRDKVLLLLHDREKL